MKKFIVFLVIVLLVVLGFYLIKSPKENKTLVAYFSATGNTAVVAQNLASAIGADVFEIKPEQPYSDADLDWKNNKSRASVEMADRASRPVIVSEVANIAQYDVIFVGFPIWWGREPSIVDTFIETYDFNGKTIVPFATSGSTPNTDEAAESIRAIAPNANVATGARFPVDVSTDDLKQWAAEWKK